MHLILYYNIAPESNIIAGDKNKGFNMVITNRRSSWLLNKYSLAAPEGIYGEGMENMHTGVGVKFKG